MMSKFKNDNTDFLFQAILALQSVDECYGFFEDLCTVAEINAFTQRIAVARMLRQNKVYNEIVQATGASTATISRVKRSLINGNDAYDKIFERLGVDAAAKK